MRGPDNGRARRFRWGRTGLGLISALVVAGCGDPADRTELEALRPIPADQRTGGTVIVGGRTSIPTLNPLVSTDFEPAQIQKHVLFATLVRFDAEQQLQPYLAESWELNRDSTQIVFHLRKDMKWHDGLPTTAHDVAFTFETVKDPVVAFPNRGWFDLWEAAEVLDPFTIRFVLQPHADFLFGWSQLAIHPEHVLGDVPAADLGGHPFGTSAPVGNGPFRFAERQGSDRWVFEANGEFPGELGGRPLVDRLVFRTVTDATTLLAELQTGGVHFYLDLPPAQMDRVAAEPSLQVVTRPSRSYTFIAWNSKRPQFADPAVRRALAMGMDRQGLIDAVRYGLGTVTAGPLGPWHWAYDPAPESLPYAPDSARAVLERAGWQDADSDGVRAREGTELRFQLVTNPNQVRQDISVILQSQLAEVGARVDLATMENAALGPAITSPERRFDAAVLGFEQDWVVDDRDLWACGRIAEPYQFGSYCNPALDPVLDSIPRTLDRDARRLLYRRYNQVIVRDQPFTFLFFETVAAGLRRELQGVRLDARGDLAGVHDWWVHPDYRLEP